MPRPTYPADIGETIRSIRQTARDAWTGAQSRARYAVIRAAGIIIGERPGQWIGIDPGTTGGAARIRLATQTGEYGQLHISPDDEGLWSSLKSYGSDGEYTGMSLLPHRGGLWATSGSGDGETVTTVQLDRNRVYLGAMKGQDGARSILTSDYGLLSAATSGAYGLVQVDGQRATLRFRSSSGRTIAQVWVDSAGGGIAARDGSGNVVASVGVGTNGRVSIYESGTAVASAHSVHAAAPPDPGASAPPDDQIAYLRGRVAALEQRIDSLPFEAAAHPAQDPTDAAEGTHG